MTIVAALVTPEGAWMGCDSLSSTDATCSVVSTPKMGKFGDKLVGFAGDWEGVRILDILRRDPTITAEQLLFRTSRFSEDLALLIVEKGTLYLVQSERVLIKIKRSKGVAYEAIGSGAPIALGALHRSHENGADLRASIRAAIDHSPHCGGPVRVVAA